MMADLVSILIPAYNAERWIWQTVESALSQEWPRTEIIIVNDGSTDETARICRSFECSRVKVISQENRGSCAARNTALQHAQGNYIQWLDHDDVLHPGKIARQIDRAGAGCDSRELFTSAFGKFFYRVRKARFDRTNLWRDLSPIEYFIVRFVDGAYFQSAAWLVSRKLTEMSGHWKDFNSPDDDGEYFSRVVSNCSGLKFVEGALSYWRVGNRRSLSESRTEEALRGLLDSKLSSIKLLLSMEDSPRTREASVRLLQTWCRYFHPDHPHLMDEVNRVATGLGGSVKPPGLKSKYRAIELLTGSKMARRCQVAVPKWRSSAIAHWDRLMFTLEEALMEKARW